MRVSLPLWPMSKFPFKRIKIIIIFECIFFYYSKLINVLQTHIKNAINNKTPESELESFGSGSEKSSEKLLYKTTKNLQYIIKFIIRSRILFAKLNDDRDRALFEASLEGKHEVFERTEWNPKNWRVFDFDLFQSNCSFILLF